MNAVPRTTTLCLRAIARPRTPCLSHLQSLRTNSTTAAPPALLQKLREDLKTSMRAKDTNRLAVVRGLLNEVTNAAKTSSPITSDLQLLSVVRKRIAAARSASDEAAAAGRQDLVDKEEAQIQLLDEYAAGVQTWSEDKIAEVVKAAVEKMKTAGDKMDSASDQPKFPAAPPPPPSSFPPPIKPPPLPLTDQHKPAKAMPQSITHVRDPDTTHASGAQTGGMIRTAAIHGKASINASIMTAQPRSKSDVHHHGEQDTIIYALRGTGSVVTDGGSTRTDLAPGDFCLIPAGVEHLEMNDTDEEVVWIITRNGSTADVVNKDKWSE
ncbi:hypothetical protein ANO11243_023200 [Dothideomycetidae sp. 11243]|nr:hypothetical protein ANO11243_023200 [fungal sp. No.11243]